jgi:hypothetical protein
MAITSPSCRRYSRLQPRANKNKARQNVGPRKTNTSRHERRMDVRTESEQVEAKAGSCSSAEDLSRVYDVLQSTPRSGTR